jgi:nitrogen fixation-related uncharacterized protein
VNGETVQSLRDAIRVAQTQAQAADTHADLAMWLSVLAVGLMVVLVILFFLFHCKHNRQHDETNRRIDHIFANMDLKKKRKEVESWEEKTAESAEAAKKVIDGDVSPPASCDSPIYAHDRDTPPHRGRPDLRY